MRLRHCLGRRVRYIAVLEVLALWCSCQIWRKELAGLEVHVYLDSTPAVGSVVRGVARRDDATRLVEDIWRVAMDLDAHPWFSWVPSSLNPADAPSRRMRTGSGATWVPRGQIAACMDIAVELLGGR